jgi:pyrroline-5-carboxylate reductase
MSESQNILLVGCGKMGGAMLRGWLSRGVSPENVRVIEPFADAAKALREELSVMVLDDIAALAPDFVPDVVVFAVKPQGMDDIVPSYAGFAAKGAVSLSIAAGRTISYFGTHLGDGAAVVRTMPNTPVAVGRGITAACANNHVSAAQRAACERLLEAVGDVVWVEQEEMIDAVTAVSGSGPAYVFLMIECMAKAGEAQGLPADIAAQLARATVAGSGELTRQSDEPASTLRQNVTSPGGTTAAALDVLMDDDDGLQPLMDRAIDAATRRSRELAG